MTVHRFEREIGGRPISIETGRLAGQADAAVTVRYGDTVILVALCVGKQPREGVDFLPLTVDYEERHYAAGKIPGGFIRREGRPTQEATLTARLTDRPLRPLLPKTWRREVQLVITVLSVDQANDPDILALIGSSAVLAMSEVPFSGPVSAVHVGCLDDELVVNPLMADMEKSPLDLLVASTGEAVAMVEAGAEEVSEDLMLRAIEFGHEANQAIVSLQQELRETCGQAKVAPPEAVKADPEAAAAVTAMIDGKLEEALFLTNRSQRDDVMSRLRDEIADALGEKFPKPELMAAFEATARDLIRGSIIDKGRRVSGRRLDEVRPLSCDTGILPRTHGSGLFNRGETQVLTIATLGSVKKEQQIDGLGSQESKRFMHHYNFPGFSVGEVKRVGGTGRREIGHGALAERALLPVLPADEAFPYTVRLVSEVLSSNGSTSMASVCASSLSLMDAGIPVSRAVAGIAMGMISDQTGKFAVLTDLEGLEDAYGDMDFKVAGTSEGITAMQMDTKLHGLTMEMVRQTITQSRDARLHILGVMNETIDTSRDEVSRYAPRMYKMSVDSDKIGVVIGPGGRMIRSIQEETGTTVDIDNEGTILIGATDETAANRAKAIIEGLTKDIEIGSVYTGKVTRLLAFGAFVEIVPGKEGMVHISELADYHVATIEDEVKVGDDITVKVIKNDMGKIGLSRKAVYETARPVAAGDRGAAPSGGRLPPRRHDGGPSRPPFRGGGDRPRR